MCLTRNVIEVEFANLEVTLFTLYHFWLHAETRDSPPLRRLSTELPAACELLREGGAIVEVEILAVEFFGKVSLGNQRKGRSRQVVRPVLPGCDILILRVVLGYEDRSRYLAFKSFRHPSYSKKSTYISYS